MRGELKGKSYLKVTRTGYLFILSKELTLHKIFKVENVSSKKGIFILFSKSELIKLRYWQNVPLNGYLRPPPPPNP